MYLYILYILVLQDNHNIYPFAFGKCLCKSNQILYCSYKQYFLQGLGFEKKFRKNNETNHKSINYKTYYKIVFHRVGFPFEFHGN